MIISNLEVSGLSAAVRGMRNPLTSQDKSDTIGNNIGLEDLKLCKKLIKAGASHRKFLRMINVYCDITAPLKFFTEFDTYLFTVQNSSSQMHTLGKRLLTEKDFDEDTDSEIIEIVNRHIGLWQLYGTEQDWRNMAMSIPQGFLYTRTVMFNYEVFMSQYHTRKNHKLKEWREYCEYMIKYLPYMSEFLLK